MNGVLTGFRIREAVAADLPACAAIVNDYLDEVTWLPRTVSRAEIAAMFVPEILTRRVILLAEGPDGVAGYLSMAPEGMIPGLYLAPAARGQGAGAQLIAAAKARRPAGLELNVFEPNLDARRFYARQGFVEVPEGRDDATEEGVPTLRLRWSGGVG